MCIHVQRWGEEHKGVEFKKAVNYCSRADEVQNIFYGYFLYWKKYLLNLCQNPFKLNIGTKRY